MFKPLLLSILFFSACQATTSASADREPATVTSAAPDFVCADQTGGAGCLEEACTFAGGNFSPDLKTCSCGTERTFVIEDRSPRCAPKEIQNACTQSYSFTSSLRDPLKRALCSSFVAKSGGSLVVNLENASKAEQAAFAKWADTRLDRELGYQFWASTVSFGDVVVIGGKITNQPSIDGLLKPFELPDEWADYVLFPPSTKYFATTKEAIAYLSGATEISRGRSPKFQTKSPTLANLLSVYESVAPRSISYEVSSRYSEGCLRSCTLKSTKLKVNDHDAWFEKSYLRGVLYRSEFVFGDANGDVVATLILADKAVSIAMEFKKSSHGLLLSATAYSADGEWLFQRSALDENALQAERALVISPATSPSMSAQTKPTENIGLCEDEISVSGFLKVGLDGALLQGPSPNSYYGWSTSPDDYWLGRFTLNRYGNSEIGGRTSHSEKVAGVLTDRTQSPDTVAIIPLTGPRCISAESASSWWPNFKASGARVLNYSMSDETDRTKCSEKLGAHPINTDRNAALWVLAAGNAPTGKVLGCPQYLVGASNVIVVGANDGERMHVQSNFGESIVDIAAPGSDLAGKSWGTSYSAPRVSRVAARLFSRYPSLTPFEIKKAILLGATVPTQPLPVLSKGFLNLENSEQIAAVLTQHQSVNRILRRLFCDTGGEADCPLVKVKLRINQRLDRKD